MKRRKKSGRTVIGRVIEYLEPDVFLKERRINDAVNGCVEHRLFGEVLDYQIGKTHPNLRRLSEYNAVSGFWKEFAIKCVKAALQNPPVKADVNAPDWKRNFAADVAASLKRGGFERLVSRNRKLLRKTWGDGAVNHPLLHAHIGLRAAKIAALIFHGLDPELLRNSEMAAAVS